MSRAQVIGTGHALPDRVRGNDALAAHLGVEPSWIVERTGIVERRVVAPGQATADLAVAAAEQALADAQIAPSALDLILVATVTPDRPLPAVAVEIQARLGARCPALDLSAACAGFVYGLSLAQGQIAAGMARRVLLIGAETLTPFIDVDDRSTVPLFGDGAGAVVLSAEASASATGEARGIVAVDLGADGRHADVLRIDRGGARHPASRRQGGGDEAAAGEPVGDPRDDRLRMEGRRVFRQAVRRLPASIEAACRAAGWPVRSIDWLVPHQANARVIQAVGKRLDLDPSRVLLDIATCGNTSAASIPIALDRAVRRGRIRAGHRVVVAGLGAGVVWGAAAIRW